MKTRWLLLIALACVILGAKFVQIDRYGSDLPFWDQWDGEGVFIIRPFHDGGRAAHDLVAAHNEHRILFTRLLAFGLFAVNDHQWDARVELLANAAVHTLAALLLAGLALRMLPGGPATAYVAIVACFFCTAVDWENTLGAFQSQFYFLILFSGLHLGATLMATPRSWMWWLAPLAGAAALFTMGSGALSAAAILGATGLRALRDRRLTRDDLWVLTINALLVIAGALLRVAVPGHHSLRAPDLAGGLESWFRQLAWPVMTPWAAPLGLMPPLAMGWAYFRGRIGGASVLGLLGACGWFWLQAAVLAYARGANLGCYASRYTDLLITGVLLNLLVLITLAAHARAARRWCWVALTVLFTGVALAGLSHEDFMVRQAVLPVLPRLNEARIAAVRSYVANRDPAFFRADRIGNLPYPSAARLAQVLDVPALRAALPASVRAPVTFADEPGSTVNFSNFPPAGVSGEIPSGLQAWATISSGEVPSSPAHFLSEPFEIDHRRVSIFVAGTSPGEAIHLSLIDDQGRRHKPLDSALSPTMRWRQVNFISPKGRGRLEVSVTGGWFAFTQPATQTVPSHFAAKAAQGGGWLLAIGAGFYLVALIAGGIAEQAVRLLKASMTAIRLPAAGLRAGCRRTSAFNLGCTVIILLCGVALVAVLLTRLRLINWQYSTGLDLVGAGTCPWLTGVPRNYAWFGVAAMAFAALLFLPGLALRLWRPNWWPAGAAYVAVPGLLLLAGIGLRVWPTGLKSANAPVDVFLAAAGCGAFAIAWQGWRNGLPILPKEAVAVAVYACVAGSALAFSVLPLEIAQEFTARSTAQGRMIASPPYHLIPYSTAAYFYSGKNGRQDSDRYFGPDWSATSRGPIVPLAIAASFVLFDAHPQDPPGVGQSPWPADAGAFYLARIAGILTNALIILGGTALATRLVAGGDRMALIALSVAPVVIANVDFLWPKLLAAFFLTLAIKETLESRALWRQSAWVALAYLSHPVGALFAFPLAGFVGYRAWREAAGFKAGILRLRASLARATAFCLWLLGWIAPWLAYKIWVGHPEAFLRYPFSDGRGAAAAVNLGSWLKCRADNIWYTLVPGAYFFSDNMHTWIFGLISQPLRWAYCCAKSLPGEMGLGLFLAAGFTIWRIPSPFPKGIRRYLIMGTFSVMLFYGGFSADGLGRNCLEPLGVFLVIATASVLSKHKRPCKWILVLTGIESLSIRIIGLVFAPSITPRLLDLETLTLLAIAVAASLMPLALLLRRFEAPPNANDSRTS